MSNNIRPQTVNLFIEMMDYNDGIKLLWWEPCGNGFRIALTDKSEWIVTQNGSELRARSSK